MKISSQPIYPLQLLYKILFYTQKDSLNDTPPPPPPPSPPPPRPGRKPFFGPGGDFNGVYHKNQKILDICKQKQKFYNPPPHPHPPPPPKKGKKKKKKKKK